MNGIKHQLQPQVDDETYEKLAGIVYIAKYLFENRELADDEFIANFPSEQGKLLNMNMVAVLDNIDEVKALDSGMDDLLN